VTIDEDVDRIVKFAAEDAALVDRDGVFPRRAIDALSEAGILALTVPAEFGGGGQGLSAAADVVRRLSNVCGSTAMVVAMHYAATAMLVAAGHEKSLTEIGAGRHLTTLAFSEAGSRSHFWAPLSTAGPEGDGIVLDARKSWVTSAHFADSYVWSSRPVDGDKPMTLWFVRADTPGLSSPAGFDGLGLRGNDSCPVTAEAVQVSRADLLARPGRRRARPRPVDRAPVVHHPECFLKPGPDAVRHRLDDHPPHGNTPTTPQPIPGATGPVESAPGPDAGRD
jgi:alkylation response protein AidB-like acyl-CoA dehydrogenase